jgi:1-acyl-sn-glycerol-3-phosphate acyltransferase
LLFKILKIPAKIAIYFYCKHLSINKKDFLKFEGPLLIAANHPNSFLDAIIVATLFKKPVYSLARGDAFANNFYTRLLRSMNMLPVYRISEGAENLEHNYKTFDACKEIFKQKGIVLIFSEGRCINEWHLRPLKKGTARLAFSSWDNGIPLKILPLGINYNSFLRFGKTVHLNFGEVISLENFKYSADSFGNDISNFNQQLNTQLQQLVYEFDKNDTESVERKFTRPVSITKKILLLIPSILGFVLHFPLFYPIKKFTAKATAKNDHYDSVVVSLLMLLYPIYLIIIAIVAHFVIGGCWWLLTFIIFPFTAWSYLQLKKN